MTILKVDWAITFADCGQKSRRMLWIIPGHSCDLLFRNFQGRVTGSNFPWGKTGQAFIMLAITPTTCFLPALAQVYWRLQRSQCHYTWVDRNKILKSQQKEKNTNYFLMSVHICFQFTFNGSHVHQDRSFAEKCFIVK